MDMERLSHGAAATTAAAAEPQQYLTFSLDEATLAMAIPRITEIIEFRDLTPVPMMPSFIRGVLNLRGAVLPVVDLKARFGRGPASVTGKTCVVIVELHSQGDIGRQDIGLMVDQVNAVVEIGAGDIEPAPAFGGGLRPDFISGMGKLNDRFVVILELDNLLCVEELAESAAAALALDGEPGAATPPQEEVPGRPRDVVGEDPAA
jgi:purine-binding chemotaxis protein CheW